MTLQWIAVDLVTGSILDDLSTFVPDLPLRSSLSNFDTATGRLYLDGVSPDWASTVRAGATLIACYDDADDTQAIQWAGYVTKTDPDTSADVVNLSLCTFEGYLARRFVPDVTYTAGALRDDVVVDLVANWIVAGIGAIPGVPITIAKVGPSMVTLADTKVWQNTDNSTVFDRITTLYGELGGEFAVEWSWASDGQHLAATLFVGDKIGTASPTGIPAVTFEQPGPVVSVSRPTDYGDGAGANVVTAYSTGQGSVTPYSDPVTLATLDGRPVFEYRYQPAASETDTAALDRHATQALGILGPGAQPLSLVLAAAETAAGTGRQLGVDWVRGDDVGYHIEPCPAFVDGLAGVARVIAVELGGDAGNFTTVTPIFADPAIYIEAA